MTFIHHDTIAAAHADDEGGSGRFDVIEEDDGFSIYNGQTGMYELDTFPTLDAAVARAECMAIRFDAARA